MKLVVSCMDRRLNKYLDAMNDGNTIFVRNGGGNMMGLRNSIRYIANNGNITEARVVDHTDCRAMGVVKEILDTGKEVGDSIKNVVDLFRGDKGRSGEEIEKANYVMQTSALKETLGLARIDGELLDTSKLEIPKTSGKLVAVVMKPSLRKYEEIANELGLELFDTYFIQAETAGEVEGDIEMANRFLGINEFVFLAMGGEEYRQVMLDKNRAEMKKLVEGKITLAKL